MLVVSKIGLTLQLDKSERFTIFVYIIFDRTSPLSHETTSLAAIGNSSLFEGNPVEEIPASFTFVTDNK